MNIKRFSSLIICLVLALSIALTACSNTVSNIDNTPVVDTNKITTVVAASDFQHPDGNEPGQEIIAGIMDSINLNGITKADGFLFCGDYAHHTYGIVEETVEGIKAIKETISPMVKENTVFVQGNHDASLGTEGLSPSGDNDPESGEYGVYVLHNSDYMWHNDNEETIKRSAQRLTEYLNEKLILSYDKPIFVISHLPLHYSMRTRYDGDGKHANYIFNVLNEAGKKGLNIIFLFGHDHSNGWDDYLGGSCIYLAKGDKILIGQNSNDAFKEETLNFTYLNAGYVGYYTNLNGADDTLSMTVFDIAYDKVTVTRYSKDGSYNLKSVGVTNKFNNESGYDPDPTVYESSQTVELTKITDNSLLENLINEPLEGTGGKYARIANANKIKDGGRYLLVYNTSSHFIMLPEVIIRENNNGVKRVGMSIESTATFGTNTVYGSFSDKEWILVKADGGWKLSTKDGKYVKLTSTQDSAITATLESDGDVFTIGGSEDMFTFTSGSYMLNYNSRGLINGYASNPAPFFIYEFLGYTVNVTNGDTSKDDAVSGETVKISADKAPSGKVFNKWVVVSGDVTIEDETATSTSFVMPDSEVRIVATYTDKQ